MFTDIERTKILSRLPNALVDAGFSEVEEQAGNVLFTASALDSGRAIEFLLEEANVKPPTERSITASVCIDVVLDKEIGNE